jgi:hypothetical protein
VLSKKLFKRLFCLFSVDSVSRKTYKGGVETNTDVKGLEMRYVMGKDGMPKTAKNTKTGSFGTLMEIWKNHKGIEYATVHTGMGKVNWRLSSCEIEG